MRHYCLTLGLLCGIHSVATNQILECKSITIPVEKKLRLTATYYNPKVGQCDTTPFETASTRIIDTTALASGKIRWVALSRNLLKRWEGQIDWGDTIEIVAPNPNLNGKWVVVDAMGFKRKRNAAGKKVPKKNSIDFLTSDKISGSFKNVYLVQRSTIKYEF